MKTSLPPVSRALTLVLIYFVVVFAGKAKANPNWTFQLHCPPNVTVSCTAELWNLSVYGNATYTYGPYTYSAGAPTVHYYLNSCNTGTITRTWMVEDYNWQWHSCTQTIYVTATGSGGQGITWPQDLELEGCNPNTNPNQLSPPYNYPTWAPSQCSMLGRSYSDMTFTVNSQCKKIMRTWKVMDWCSYNQGSGAGMYTHVQWIYIISKTPPEVTCPAEITVKSFNCKNAQVIVPPLAIDPSVCGGDFTVTNNSPYATSNGNNISGTYPIGTTKVTWSVKYGCNKTKTCTTNVVVVNASKPVPYCLGVITTALMGVDTDHDGKVDDGMVEIWAKDLDKGSKSACGYGPLKFSFSKNVTHTSRTFTCDHIGKNLVEMWVTDTKGAQNFCLVEVIIQNNGANIPDCHPLPPPPPVDSIHRVKGHVLTLTDTPLKGAEITLRYGDPIVTYQITRDTTEQLQLDSFINASGYKLYRYILVKKITEHKDSTVTYVQRTAVTDSTGNFRIDSLTVKDKKVRITAGYTDDPHRFIDNKDVELLTKFLLGEVTFSSFHQYLASDINEDGKVDIEDQNLLMAFVTGQAQSLPGSHSWYVLDSKATYNKPEDVLTQPLPLTVTLDSIPKPDPAVFFIAVKKGNISVDPGSVLPDITESRMAGSLADFVTIAPNPFSDEVNFEVNVPGPSSCTLELFNSSGQQVHRSEAVMNKGTNTIRVAGDHLPYDLLMYRIACGDKTKTGTLVRIR